MCFHILYLLFPFIGVFDKMLRMNDKQASNLAKFFYDIAKIDFAALVVAQLANPSNLKYWILVVGIIATIIPLLVGLALDKKENKK